MFQHLQPLIQRFRTHGLRSPHRAMAKGTALLVWLGCGVGLSVTLGQSGLMPLVAQAYEARTDVTLELQGGETYSNVVRRAETVARAAAQRSFDRDILITDVAIVVYVEAPKGISPLLTLKASRPQWSGRPDARRWSTYYPMTKTLLAIPDPSPPNLNVTPLKTPPQVPTTQPGTTPATKPTAKPTAKPMSAPTKKAPGQSQSTPKPSTSPAVPGAVPTSPSSNDNDIPSIPQPTRSPIIPQRIPTPAGIGK